MEYFYRIETCCKRGKRNLGFSALELAVLIISEKPNISAVIFGCLLNVSCVYVLFILTCIQIKVQAMGGRGYMHVVRKFTLGRFDKKYAEMLITVKILYSN